MTRKEFIVVVAAKTGRKPSTVAQYIYIKGFKAAAYKMKGHIRRPDYSLNQVQAACDMVLSNGGSKL